MSSYLSVFDNSKVYVVCPSNNKTGGTELLHQIVAVLKKNNCNAMICYYLEGKNASKKQPTPLEFKKYIDEFVFYADIEDDEKNIVVFPEICLGKHRKFKKIQKVIWWLSVDNYKAMKGKVNRLRKYGLLSYLKHLCLGDYINDNDVNCFKLHMYQSRYALEFIKSLGIKEEKTVCLSDYINDIYLKKISKDNRKDYVVYNPKKGIEFTRKIIAIAHEIKFVPLINMSNTEVIELLNRSKVYIDFGNHPGKDRIPREAAMSGCCVITNKRGAAQYSEDVPIGDKYKFDDIDDNLEIIVNAITRCIEDYETVINDFEYYREFISKEKCKFENDAMLIFSKDK